MYTIIVSSSYRKAFKRLARNKNFNRIKLESVIHILECGEKLESKYLDHELKGKLDGFRECHIQNDILLIYQIIKDQLILVLINVGSHSELF